MRWAMTMSSLGFASGSVIQEFGYDDDVDEAVRAQIEEETGQEKTATSTTSPTSFSI